MAWSNFFDGGTITKKCVKTSPGTLFSIRATNTNAALRWLQVHNKASDPAGTDVPIISVPIPVTSGIVTLTPADLGGGEACATGVSWAISASAAVFTDTATASEHSVFVKFQ